jgi:hypothetical protein
MRSRILKRPMFRMGGDVENTGIMDGMRNRYAESDPKGVQPRRDPMLFTPSLNDFLIQFGLNLASGTPRGNIIATAAEEAKDPFAVMQAKRMRGGELESDREFKRELLAEELKAKKEIAEIGQNIKNYDTYLKFGIDQYNDMVKAENYANFMTNIKPRIDADFGGTQLGGFIEQDITKESVKNKFIKNNAGKIGSVFFDLNTNQLFQLKRIDNEGNVDLVPTSITNMKDIEGTTMPETEKKELGFKQTEYQKDIARKTEQALKEREEERKRKVDESLRDTSFDDLGA